jgi:hypothetical protein
MVLTYCDSSGRVNKFSTAHAKKRKGERRPNQTGAIASFIEGLYAPVVSSFSQRQGYGRRPPEIKFREELPEHLRIPIYDILKRNLNPAFLLERAETLFNPYGIDTLPAHNGSMLVTKEEDDPKTISIQAGSSRVRVVPGLRPC